MADVVEATSNVGVQDIFVLVRDTAEYCLYRIMTGASWAEPVAVAFKLCFPLWFEGLFC